MIIEDAGYLRNMNPNILMGAPFLRAYYSSYDIKNRKIGLIRVPDIYRTEDP